MNLIGSQMFCVHAHMPIAHFANLNSYEFAINRYIAGKFHAQHSVSDYYQAAQSVGHHRRYVDMTRLNGHPQVSAIMSSQDESDSIKDGSAATGNDDGKSRRHTNLVIRTLNEDDFTSLHRCWCEAFSDYKLSLDVTAEQLSIRLRQDSYSPHLSVGAFFKGIMVGFWLSGMRRKEGVNVGYDAGTAIVPAWRGRGVSSLLARELNNQISKQGVNNYILEVFCDNDDALQLYRKQGFEIRRTFHAYRADPPLLDHNAGSSLLVERSSLEQAEQYIPGLLDYEPSWQNSLEAIREIEDSAIIYLIKDGGDVVAYTIFQPLLRRIAQIGMIKAIDSKEAAITLAMLTEIYKHLDNNGYIEIVNIPGEPHRIVNILNKFNFKSLAALYEMKRDINNEI